MLEKNTSLPPAMFEPTAFREQLQGKNAIQKCKDAIAASARYLHQQFHAGAQARDLIRLRAAFMDELLGALWDCQDWGTSQLALSR